MAVPLLKHSCPCPRNRILRACIQNLLQNKTGTFKNNHGKWCFSFFFICICEAIARIKGRTGNSREMEFLWNFHSNFANPHRLYWLEKLQNNFVVFKALMLLDFLGLLLFKVNVTAPTPSGKAVFFLWYCCWKSAGNPVPNDPKLGSKILWACVCPFLNLKVQVFHFRGKKIHNLLQYFCFQNTDLGSDSQNFGLPPLWDW